MLHLRLEVFLNMYPFFCIIGKISLTSPIVINVPTRASLAVKTKVLLFLWLANLLKKSNVCMLKLSGKGAKQRSQVTVLCFTNKKQPYPFTSDNIRPITMVFRPN